MVNPFDLIGFRDRAIRPLLPHLLTERDSSVTDHFRNSSGKCGEQATNFVLNVGNVLNCLGDLMSEQLSISFSHAVCRHFGGGYCGAE
jgi:hypothetical protein